MTILCVGENENVGQSLCAKMSRCGWKVEFLLGRPDMEEGFRRIRPDLIVLDVVDLAYLHWWYGLKVTRGCRTLIFIGEGIGSESIGFDAELQMLQTFLPRNILGSRHFALSLRSLMMEEELRHGPMLVPQFNLTIDHRAKFISLNSSVLHLTQTEFRILCNLATSRHGLVDRLQLKLTVFGDGVANNRALDVHICSIRKKIRPLGLDVAAIRGVGYQLTCGEVSA